VSRETVDGDGIYCSGRPVFIRLLYLESLTTSNGLMFSETHRTVSALVSLDQQLTASGRTHELDDAP
jgi:hypothetical protein